MSVNATEVARTIQALQEDGNKVLVFVVPVDPDALATSTVSSAEIEERVQKSLENTLNTCLHGRRDPAEPPLPDYVDLRKDMEKGVYAYYDRFLPLLERAIWLEEWRAAREMGL